MRPPRSLLLLIGFVACGGSPSEPTPATVSTNYSGVFATGTQSGTITLTIGNPATGTLRPAGGASIALPAIPMRADPFATRDGLFAAPVPLTGTYVDATKTFTMAGGGYNLTATIDGAGQVSGTLNGTTADTKGVVSALATNPATATTTYCGTFSGTNSGRLSVVVRGTEAKGLAVEVTGEGTNLSGTVSGNTVTLGWKPLGAGGVVGTGTATGTISGSTLAGSWTNTLGERGTFTTTSTGC